jgi:hypothetical protein
MKALSILPAATGITCNEMWKMAGRRAAWRLIHILPASRSIMLNGPIDWQGWQGCGRAGPEAALRTSGASAQF